MPKTGVTPRNETALELDVAFGRPPDHEVVSVNVQFLVAKAKSISPIGARQVSDRDLPAWTSPSVPGRIEFRWFSHGTPRSVSIRENCDGLQRERSPVEAIASVGRLHAYGYGWAVTGRMARTHRPCAHDLQVRGGDRDAHSTVPRMSVHSHRNDSRGCASENVVLVM